MYHELEWDNIKSLNFWEQTVNHIVIRAKPANIPPDTTASHWSDSKERIGIIILHHNSIIRKTLRYLYTNQNQVEIKDLTATNNLSKTMIFIPPSQTSDTPKECLKTVMDHSRQKIDLLEKADVRN